MSYRSNIFLSRGWRGLARRSATVFASVALAMVIAVTETRCEDVPPASSVPATHETARAARAVPSYVLGSGDHVHITVYGQPDLTGDYSVDGAGVLHFPLVGDVEIGGLTADQASHAIEAKLSPNYLKDPHVSVEVLTYRPFYIVGEVKTPGSYPYVSGMTVLNAVALAGGFTYRARENSFYITRNGADGKKDQIDANATAPVLPGDIITVRERYF